jgi:hypothetical protein
MKLKLTCTQRQFDDLHQAIDKVKRTSTTVKVDKQALINLLIDHGKLVAKLTCEVDL